MGLQTDAQVLRATFLGRTLAKLARREADWLFSFDAPGPAIMSDTLWRFRNETGILVTSEDHDQRFGLPQTMDVIATVEKCLAGHSITTVELDMTTGDLCLGFHSRFRLELLTTSCGYESWQAYDVEGTLMAVGANHGLR